MASKKRKKILETRYFGLIIGVLVIFLFFFISESTNIIQNLELNMLDLYFKYKDLSSKQKLQEGVSIERRNPKISEDILIVGVDFNSLSKFGKFPFPRYRHADLLNSFTRIKNQNERELSIFLDLFFIEPDKKSWDDALMIEAMKNNGRVFLETVLDENPAPAGLDEEFFSRQHILYENDGEIRNIKGNWEDLHAFLGVQSPLKPYAGAVAGYGHANYHEDFDQTYRRQPLIAKSSELIAQYRFDSLIPDMPLARDNFERLVWEDKEGKSYNLPYPLTQKDIDDLAIELEHNAPLRHIDNDDDGVPDDSYYVIRKYRDHFVPAITLSLALEYFHKNLDDIEIVLGEHIYIPHPEYFDTEQNSWVPYEVIEKEAEYDEEGQLIAESEKRIVNEITIPIDENGIMLINFMGPPSVAEPDGWKTYPIRSYSGYAANPPGKDPAGWPPTKAVGNKIIMVGAFARGIAADEKTTPLGLMYGVEIHANALNTILMDNFIENVPQWADFIVLAGLVMIVAFMTSRLSTVWSLVVTLFLILALFISITIIFDQKALIISFTNPAIAAFFSFLTIVVYRAMTEEKDKRRIRNIFGKYVSPKVVDQILENPPELGGVDKELTVFFSDIRGFTTLSESLTPQELVNHLNEYLTAMTDTILEYQGTLDKYEGDAIMCFWGAPLPQQDHALRACKSALKQMIRLKELNKTWPEERRINIGIGLNSGIMTVGNMGSPGRMDYTIMGDAVNLGARLEGANKQYFTNIIISEHTYGLVKDHVVARELDNIRVKGKNKPVLIYELIDVIGNLAHDNLITGTGNRKRKNR
jgi:adenylate cyclase